MTIESAKDNFDPPSLAFHLTPIMKCFHLACEIFHTHVASSENFSSQLGGDF